MKNFWKNCAGARAGAKIGLQVRAPHITIFVRCACGCGPNSPHTKGLSISIEAQGIFSDMWQTKNVSICTLSQVFFKKRWVFFQFFECLLKEILAY